MIYRKIRQKKEEEPEYIKELKAEFHVMNLLSECTQDSIEEAIEKLHEFDNQILLENYIFKLSTCRPFSLKLLGNVYEAANLNIEHLSHDSDIYKYLSMLHTSSGEQNEQIVDLNYYENPFKDQPLEYSIATDNVTDFLSYVIQQNINLKNQIIQAHGYFFYITQFACYSGSSKIFKYCFINLGFNEKDVQFAVEGGNEAIIEFLVNHDYEFDNQLEIAIAYHHNNLAKWLFDNYQSPRIELGYCMEKINLEMAFYFLTETYGYEVDEISTYPSPLFTASKMNAIRFARFLLEKGANKNLKYGQDTPQDVICSQEMKELLNEYDEPMLINI